MSRVIADFVPIFVAMATGYQTVNLNDALKLAVPENPTLEPNITTLSCVQRYNPTGVMSLLLNFPLAPL